MYDEILKECLEAKKRLVDLFGDLETYMEFYDKAAGEANEAGHQVRRFTSPENKKAGKA